MKGWKIQATIKKNIKSKLFLIWEILITNNPIMPIRPIQDY